MFRGAKSFDNAMISLLRNQWLHVVLTSYPDPSGTKLISHSRANDERYSPGRTTLFAQPRQATNAAARTELCYISLASPALSIQATCTHISSLNEHVAAQKSQKLVRPWPELLGSVKEIVSLQDKTSYRSCSDCIKFCKNFQQFQAALGPYIIIRSICNKFVYLH